MFLMLHVGIVKMRGRAGSKSNIDPAGKHYVLPNLLLSNRLLRLYQPLTVDCTNHVIVFVNYLTKWPEAFAVGNQEALTIARLLVLLSWPTCQ